MSKMLSLVLAAGLLAFPPATYAVDYGSQPPSQTQQSLPVAQPLVREGDFAIKLATELGLGSPSDEAAAEDLLAEAGISPENGWISDYPVTPEIIGQLDASLERAASEGKLHESYESAKQDLADIATELALPLPAEDGTQTAEAPPATGEMSDYYATEGPPVVTYYAPPASYAYLYDWVPYPAVWFGISFPGFFICHQFSRVVTVGPFFGLRHPHRAIVSNRFFDPATRRHAFVEHGFRGAGDAIRPHTILRSDHGRTFGGFGQLSGPGGGSSRMTPGKTPMTPRSRPIVPHIQSPAPRGNIARSYSPRSSGSPQAPSTGARRSFSAPQPHGLQSQPGRTFGSFGHFSGPGGGSSVMRPRPALPKVQPPIPRGNIGRSLPPRSFVAPRGSLNTPQRAFNAPRPPSSAYAGRYVAPPTPAPAGQMHSRGAGRAAGGGRMGGGGRSAGGGTAGGFAHR